MRIRNHRLVAEPGEQLNYIPSPNQARSVTPLYLIMHYTAGPTLDGAVSWFMNPQAQASAHVIVDRDGTVVQMVDFNRKAWHAGKSSWGHLEGLNAYSIGIELVNAGKLSRRSDGEWVNWSKKVIPAADVTIATHKDETIESGWHEYPEAQIDAALRVSIALQDAYSFRDVLGHDDISPRRKVDPGPLFPLGSFRSKVLGRA